MTNKSLIERLRIGDYLVFHKLHKWADALDYGPAKLLIQDGKNYRVTGNQSIYSGGSTKTAAKVWRIHGKTKSTITIKEISGPVKLVYETTEFEWWEYATIVKKGTKPWKTLQVLYAKK